MVFRNITIFGPSWPEVLKGGTEIRNEKELDISKSITFESGRGFALGHIPEAPGQDVIWHFTEMANKERNYYDYRLCNGFIPPEQEFDRVVSAYQYVYNVPEKIEGQTSATNYYRYYATQQPVNPGTFPKSSDCMPLEIANYDKRLLVEGGTMRAWGEIIYMKPLTEKQMYDYELKPFPDNPDREKARPSITARLKEAASRPEPGKKADRPKPSKSYEDR